MIISREGWLVESREKAEARLRENLLDAQVMAALGGNDLGPFEPVDGPGMMKYQAFACSAGNQFTLALWRCIVF
jgi:hypothetical protein